MRMTVVMIVSALGLLSAAPVGRAGVEQNLASGLPVKFYPSPNYALCTDAGDPTQLTDGKLADPGKQMWQQKTAAVGWQGVPFVTLAVDLGKVQPISEVALHVGAGSAGVQWPHFLRVLLSDDGKSYHDLGNLSLSRPETKATGYESLWYKSQPIEAHGRYVLLLAAVNESFFFTDEMTVRAGEASWLGKPMPGTAYAGARGYMIHIKSERRVREDIQRVHGEIAASSLKAEVKQSLLARVENLRAEADARVDSIEPEGVRAILPLNDLDRRALAIWGAFLQARGLPALSARAANPWDPMTWISLPQSGADEATVYAMRGETRPAAINLTNATTEPMNVTLEIEALDQRAGLRQVAAVDWTDTNSGVPIAAALIRQEVVDNQCHVTIPAGVTRQVWLSFKPGASGRFSGSLVARDQSGHVARARLSVNVFNLDFPKEQHLHIGGWDYTDSDAGYGVTAQNRRAIISLMREYGFDTVWAKAGPPPWKQYDAYCGRYDEQGNMLSPPDMTHLDRWLEHRRGEARYAIYLDVTDRIGPCRAGTPEFHKAAGEWAKYVARWATGKGISPDQLLLLFVDEPHYPEQFATSIAWAKGVRDARTGLRCWTDPAPRPGTLKALPEEFTKVFDNFCILRQYLIWRQPLAENLEVMRRLKADGKELELYGTQGPMKEQDPYSYVRLQAWLAWKLGADASSFWSITDDGWSSFYPDKSPSLDWMPYSLSRDGSYSAMFLDDTSATPAKHLAAMRAGAEDYEYPRMLDAALKKARAGKRDPKLIRRGEALLGAGVDKVLSDGDALKTIDDLKWSTPKDRGEADRTRAEIGRLLEELEASGG